MKWKNKFLDPHRGWGVIWSIQQHTGQYSISLLTMLVASWQAHNVNKLGLVCESAMDLAYKLLQPSHEILIILRNQQIRRKVASHSSNGRSHIYCLTL